MTYFKRLLKAEVRVLLEVSQSGISGKQTATRKGVYRNRVELDLSGLIGMAGCPDMQKIRISGFLLKMGYIGSLKSSVTIYSLYPRLSLSTTPDLRF